MAGALLVLTCGAVAQAWWRRVERLERSATTTAPIKKKTEEFHVVVVEIFITVSKIMYLSWYRILKGTFTL